MMTDRPFFPTPTAWGEARVLGLDISDVEKWRGLKVLEVGPGEGHALQELTNNGFDIEAIEPSLKYLSYQYLQELYSKRGVADKVYPFFAQELPNHLTSRYDIAFAAGINFQNYDETIEDFIDSLSGIFSVLNRQGVLYFQVELKQGQIVCVGFSSRRPINLSKIFERIHAKCELSTKPPVDVTGLGDWISLKYGLKVDRFNGSVDILEGLSEIKTDSNIGSYYF